ncbi:Wall-associated protein precursor [Stigmatella sp. ncwal1]|uniref:Wall-associated protein n=1 Tax=Stigmatella ashevillensis TaxID=2995309 RepID=A0ABT5D629_9BACT|nr:Wall-associated protein precursor [Stigmatella ashevillena]MDC0707687.1 Wall-associated protein precursor [Stigmatella ashevillena]
MLSLLLLLLTQVPAVPGETTLVSFCKQGRASACEALKQVNPQRAAEIARDLAALKFIEDAREQSAETSEEGIEAAPEPPNCKGQNHHIISRPIAKRLKGHSTLGGLYKPRDPRFVAKAKDDDSHCGYQDWHRRVDKEVIDWLDENPKATSEQFEKFLRAIYNRPELLKRFPRGF